MGFDAQSFLKSGGSIAGLGASFGIPSCMLNLAGDVLGLIPTPILLAMRTAMQAGRILADAVIKRINAYIRELLGISLFPDRDGFFGYFSEYSRFGLDLISGITGALGAFIGFAQAAAQAADELAARFEAAEACLSKFKDSLDFTNANASEYREGLATADRDQIIDSQFGVYFQQSQLAQQFIDDVDAQLAVIDSILLQRTLDPSLEPGAQEQAQETVFRLEAGPPRSTTGKFILSVDGLYYDSQTSGIQPALLELATREELLAYGGTLPVNPNRWKLEQDPNLGGRGVPTTIKDLEFYFNTILDPDILDNSPPIVRYYEKDELLLSLEGQKDRRVFDVSGNIQELIDDGESQAVIDNLRQVMLSEASHFQDKINRRKKQIELAVKVPTFLGNGSLFNPGEIPVNDFSYLAGSNFLVDVANQRRITISQDDVDGVVLPLETKYSEKVETSDPIVLSHILLANVAKGETIPNPEEPSGITLQVTDRITEDGLFAMYNYLTVDTSETSGTDYGVHNSSRYGYLYNSQMVGSPSKLFPNGLGIPFLSGVAFPASGSSDIGSMGSYIKLPQKNEFKDFLYNLGGATFETWAHIPNLDGTTDGYNLHDNSTLGLYRLILANENVGISDSTTPQGDINNMSPNLGTGTVRGSILGFTRDRRFTLGLDPSNAEEDNDIENLVLVLAPTQSYDSSSAGFIANRETNCNKDSYYGMTVPVFESFNGKSLSSCGNSFVHISVAIDPQQDEVRVYADGVKLATSSYQTTFPVKRVGETYKAPSIKQNNSFEYSGGPSLDDYFTPWILGGGYTDGFSAGNFMGGEYGGKFSGLRGYLGCTRFYSKPLSDAEILNNYKATRNFFDNIEVPNSMWEPLNIP